MAQSSGFFDAIETGGQYDRTYSSADFCDNLATVIKNGVNYTVDDDLKVSNIESSMSLAVNRGRAWINGHYYFNDTRDTTSLTIATAPTGIFSRIDRVVVRLDTTTSVRAAYLAIVQGEAAQNPVAPALTRNEFIYELCLATITIPAGATEITEQMITDTRGDNSVCGWAASVSPAVMSLLRSYKWNTTLTENTQVVTFDVPEFRADMPMIVRVYTNGILDVENVDYTRNGETITFNQMRLVGSDITVYVDKSIDGTGLADVNDEIQKLQEDVNKIKSDYDYIYFCNGLNDNVNISNIAQKFLQTNTDNAMLKIRVVGQNIGMRAPVNGSGTNAAPNVWFNLGMASKRTRRVIIDFTNAGQIAPTITPGSTNVIFGGNDINVIGACVLVEEKTNAATTTKIFSGTNPTADKCYFKISQQKNGFISESGTFNDCRGIVMLSAATAYCFAVASKNTLRLFGGTYRAYTGSSQTLDYSAVVCCWYSDAAAYLNGVNMPQVTVSGYTQKYICSLTAGKSVIRDCFSIIPANNPVGNTVSLIGVNDTSTT